MRKEIEALKSLIACQDAEEEARRKMEAASIRFRSSPYRPLSSPDELPEDLKAATKAWAYAFAELATVRGLARCLILDAEAEMRRITARELPRDDENGPAARLPT